MADFSTPFGNNAGRRLPTSDEKINGFPCGAADQTLFNGLFHRLEAEIGEVIGFAGLTPTDARFTQLREAIQALISSATGGGDTSQFLLLSQITARLPVFPEIQSTDGRINVTSPATGTVRIPGGVNWIHRGVDLKVTDQTDFATVANKTYHIRWNTVDGFVLRDLANATYNPSTLAEDDTTFDTTFDDMLIARVVTNSSNVPTITNLANKADLTVSEIISGSDYRLAEGNSANALIQSNLAWSRKPSTYNLNPLRITVGSNVVDTDMNFYARSEDRTVNGASFATVIPLSRYELDVVFMRDGMSHVEMSFNAKG